jgi:hypothetical protein
MIPSDAMSRQFGVHGVERASDPTIVIGRCYIGPLRVGDVFVRNQLPAGQELRSIRLTIAHMEAYRHSMDELDEGLTARLTLTGDGGVTIVAESVLGT